MHPGFTGIVRTAATETGASGIEAVEPVERFASENWRGTMPYLIPLHAPGRNGSAALIQSEPISYLYALVMAYLADADKNGQAADDECASQSESSSCPKTLKRAARAVEPSDARSSNRGRLARRPAL
jgi:hypothetical protein